MKIVGKYNFNDGKNYIEKNYKNLLTEIEEVISKIDAKSCKTKISKEKTIQGKNLYSPFELNKLFKKHLKSNGWESHRENCEYPTKYYLNNYQPKKSTNIFRSAYREIDFVKNKLGVEVQFGKYSFMVYNVCAKMTIFKNLKVINAGIEIVPIKEFANEMSTGVSYFEQFAWDLEQRGVSNIDIPVLVIGINK